ncbi:MAG: hypothetical protein H6Q76_1224 [Firmicutes bacterium]|nr:hypothetical protein [Bacillota bacterium]
MYLLYVGAIMGCAVLLLRRSRRRRQTDSLSPKALEVALLRGGLGAVVETVIFELHERKIIELKPDGPSRKLLVQVSSVQGVGLSQLEAAAVQAFMALQGNVRKLGGTRRQLVESLRAIEENMQKAGWWKTPARWQWVMSVIVPCLIVAGSLRFMNYYEGTEKWLLALTVPLLAVLGRRIVLHEMSGPTKNGQKLLAKLRESADSDGDPLLQVALFGSQHMADKSEQRIFCVMTRSIPYGYLR